MSTKIIRFIIIFTIAIPVFFAIYNKNSNEQYIQTGSGIDPLKIKISLPIKDSAQKTPTTSTIIFDIVLNAISTQNFLELYCYDPIEIAGKKFFIANVTIENKKDKPYPISLKQFFVTDETGKRYSAFTDMKIYDDGDYNQPFTFDYDRTKLNGDGNLEPNNTTTGDLVFVLAKSVVPKKIIFEADSQKIELSLP